MRITIAGRIRSAALAAVVVAGMLVMPLAPPASADPSPAVDTVGADALPTWQVNGVVWSQAVVGTTVYVTGSFSTARPPGVPVGGVGEIPAQNIFAYDITTGAPVAGFSHSLNGQGLVIRGSEDGSRVYVGGDFTAVDGTARGHLAAFSTATGALLPWAPNIGGQVRGIAVTPYAVFVGGSFPSANGLLRNRLASFEVGSGDITDWAPAVAGGGGAVWAMVMSPDQSQVVVGGSFTTLNGTAAYGMGALDASTGATRPWAAQERIRTAGTKGAITSLKADDTSVYGSGYSYGSGATFEGTFAADPDGGAIEWVNDCLGDTYDVSPLSGALYSVSHAHDCSAIGGFPDTSPRTFWQKAMASSLTPSGTITGLDAYGWDFRGLPHTDLLQWYPDLSFGSYTSSRQAAWSVEGSGDYVVLGGEFPRVNGVAQQGLVRFLKKSVGPHSMKPLYLPSMNPVATSTESGSVRIRFGSTWDRDDEQLTYDIYRDGGPSIGSVTPPSIWWKLPPLLFTDAGRTPGATHTYTVRARDAVGNVQWSLTSNSVVVSAEPGSAYADQVRADGAQHLWRLDSDANPSPDAIGAMDLSLASLSQVTGVDGGALRSPGSASSRGATTFAQAKPGAVTLEAWVNTTSGSGGRIIGLGNAATGSSSTYDLALYLGNNGRVNLGVRNAANALVTTTSNQAVNDGQWHHVVGVVERGGSTLVIDGQRSGRNQNATGGPGFEGYWRVFGDNTSGLANRPSSSALAGTLDEVAVYPSALPIDTIRSHYTTLSGLDPADPTPTDTYGASVTADSPDIYWRLGEASGSIAQDASASASDGTLTGIATYGLPGAVTGTPDTALAFNGSSGFAASRQAWGAPTEYSTEAWFQTTTTQGGRIIGFGSSATSLSSSYDRLVCMQNDGRLLFGVNSGGQQTIVTPTSYNDGQWHHVVATQGAGGMRLYVDGIQQGTNPTTTGEAYTGYWRAGGDRCFSGATSSYFAGVLDEVAVYPRVLAPTAVVEHFEAGGGVVANQPPTASFTSTPSFLTVAFDGTASSDPDGEVVSHDWTFGDGTTATGPTATHVYASEGTFSVRLTVTDDRGAVGTTIREVTVVRPPNQLPAAAFESTTTFLDVALDGSASSDSDGTISSYEWDFGDGSTGTGLTTSHTYAAAGDYAVTLTVTDDRGGSAVETRSVTVAANAAPSADFTTSTTGLTVSTDATTSTDADGTIASYAWDFGDGTSATGVSSTHEYASEGTYTVQLTVTDDQGASGTTTREVTVVRPPNQLPTAAFESTATALEVAFDASGSADPDGTVESHEWDFGDGATGTGPMTSHVYGDPGDYDVTLTVTDDRGGSATRTTTVTVAANVAPEARIVASVDLLAVSVDGSTSSDGDGTIASYEWDFGDGTQGSGPTTSHAYAADGTYTVRLTVTDDGGLTDSATTEVTVVGDPSVARDAFDRAVTGGWGTADRGGVWTLTGALSRYSVAEDVGSVSLGAGAGAKPTLGSVSITDLELRTVVTTDKAPTGGGQYVSLVGRATPGGPEYRAKLHLASTGAVTTYLTRVVAGTETSLGSAVVPGMSYTPGTKLKVRFQAVGTSPSTLRVKVWPQGQSEPAAWLLSRTDATAAMQSAGSIGFYHYLSGSATNAPVVFTVDEAWVGPPQP